GWGFQIEGRPPATRGEVVSAILQTASPNFTSLLHIGLLDGRQLEDSDRAESQPVCVVSELLASRYFSGQNPIGHKIKMNSPKDDNRWMTVVGIVKDVRYGWIRKDLVPTIYRSFRQAPPSYTTLLIRTAGVQDPARLGPEARAAIASIDPNLPLY